MASTNNNILKNNYIRIEDSVIHLSMVHRFDRSGIQVRFFSKDPAIPPFKGLYCLGKWHLHTVADAIDAFDQLADMMATNQYDLLDIADEIRSQKQLKETQQ